MLRTFSYKKIRYIKLKSKDYWHLRRESEGKDLVTIYDYVDSSIPMLERMFNKREKGKRI